MVDFETVNDVGRCWGGGGVQGCCGQARAGEKSEGATSNLLSAFPLILLAGSQQEMLEICNHVTMVH